MYRKVTDRLGVSLPYLAAVAIVVAVGIGNGWTLAHLLPITSQTKATSKVSTSAVATRVSNTPYAFRGLCHVEQADGKWRQPGLDTSPDGGGWRTEESNLIPCANLLTSLDVDKSGNVTVDSKGDDSCFHDTSSRLWLKAEPQSDGNWLISWGTVDPAIPVEWLRVVSNGNVYDPDPNSGSFVWRPQDMATEHNLTPYVAIFANDPSSAGCRID